MHSILAQSILTLTAVVFFLWKDWVELIPLSLTILLNYFWARLIYRLPFPNARKLVLWIGIAQNLSLLVVYRHLQILPDEVQTLLSPRTFFLHYAVSIYIFEAISILFDVYRKEAHPPTMLEFGYFYSFFPRFFAGPIIRFQLFANQLVQNPRSQIKNGLRLLLLGLALNLPLAEAFRVFADYAFAPKAEVSFSEAWIGTIAFLFQTYFTFSGYALVASGVALCFGFQYPENFRTPLLATSVTEFWNRWNLTLGNWIKAYFYLPWALHFKNSKFASGALLFSTMVFIGLWHGLELKHLCFGIWFGAWLIFEQVDRYHEKIPPVLKGIFTFCIVAVGFQFLAVRNVDQSILLLNSLFARFDVLNISFELIQSHPWHGILSVVGILYTFFLEPKMTLRKG